ncbi:MAG: hypothetical protein HY663_00555 [Chloroflexi bacterium]|nr:hypothetical protein [Chloroflexota bacterium]
METEIIILGNKTLGKIEGPLFGQFLELGGRCINGGVFDPGSSRSRPDGIREDVLQALKELCPTHIRYPGGCGASYFNWQELVGPVEERPRAKLFRYTRVPQSTAFGIPEAYAYCRELGAELYLIVNAHTQTPEDAANLVEYLNATTPTRWADLRRAHGRAEPYNVRLFGLGNEIYGDWQAGQKTAEEYVAWCREAILQMKRVDPSIQVVVCGCSRLNPEWDRTILFGLISIADMISIHNYFGRPVFKDCMAAYRVCEEMFTALNVAIDEAMDTTLGVHPRTHRELGVPPAPTKRPGIAFDEWNVWYRTTHEPEHDLEEIYNYADALTVATLFHVILRNTRTVKMSNISLAVNVLGGVFTDHERCVRQTIWYAQKLIRDGHSGRVVETVVVDAPVLSAKHERFFCGIVDPDKSQDETLPTLLHYDDIPAIDVLVSVDSQNKKACLSIVQKMEDRPLTVRLSFRGLQPKGDSVKVSRLTGDSLSAANTLLSPGNVGIKTETQPMCDVFTIPPSSLTVFEFKIE